MLEQIFDPRYRIELNKEIVQRAGAEHVVLFDDVEHVVPDSQKGALLGLAGYQRMLFDGAAFSAVAPTTVLLRAPFHPVELAIAQTIRQKLGAKNQLRVLLVFGEKLVDQTNMSISEWPNLATKFMETAGGNPESFFSIFQNHREEIFQGRKSLLLPMQTQGCHHHFFVDDQLAVLLSDAEPFNDKNWSADQFLSHGLGHYIVPGQDIPEAGGNQAGFAEAVLRAIDNFPEQFPGMLPYAKLEKDGVSGIASLDPIEYPIIYDPRVNWDQRMGDLLRVMRERGVDGSVDGRVEQYRPPERDELGAKEITIGGFQVGDTLFPTSFGRMLLQGPIFKGMLHLSSIENMGLNGSTAKVGDILYSFGRVLPDTGYHFGYVAVDLIPLSDIRVNDYNFRRGGRSAGETLKWVLGGDWYDYEYLIPVTDHQQQVLEIPQRLYDRGVVPYSTSLLFFPEQGKLKIKVLIPMTLLRVPRDSLHETAKKLIMDAVAGV